MSSLFAKAIAECNVSLKWIKNKDMLTMVEMVKASDEEQMLDTSITLRKLIKNEIKWEEFKPYKRSCKTKM